MNINQNGWNDDTAGARHHGGHHGWGGHAGHHGCGGNQPPNPPAPNPPPPDAPVPPPPPQPAPAQPPG